MDVEIILLSRKLTSYQREWCDDYLKRLQGFCKTDVVFLKDPNTSDPGQNVEHSWEIVKKKLRPSWKKVLLNIEGKSFISEEFSQTLSQWVETSGGRLQFVIGGAYGFPEMAKKSFDATFSLSSLTFPHRLALLILLEQLYRAFTIQRGHPYHHGG